MLSRSLLAYYFATVQLLSAGRPNEQPITLEYPGRTIRSPIKSRYPLGLSFEFFAFPSYMTDVQQTATCISNLESALGACISFRIGGTTQDRATYDRNQKTSIKYELPPGSQVPLELTFGPKFIDLAASLKGPTTLGLNRRSNNVRNAAEVTQMAMLKMQNLYAIELGNEPEFWGSRAPVARQKPWTPLADAESQLLWQEVISEKVQTRQLIQAGVFLSPPRWSVVNLASMQGNNIQYVKSFGGHAYPQSACGRSETSLPNLMSHSETVSFVKRFKDEINAAASLKIPYHLSETNSATCGGKGISVTFGAGLWIIDYVFQSILQGVARLYFHQGTVDHSPYSFWDHSKVSAPFYGAYFTALALRSATQISSMETHDEDVAAYTFWRCNRLIRLVVYHSEFFSGEGQRPLREVTLPGITSSIKSARLLRFTAQDALVAVTDSDNPTIGRSYFDKKTCKLNTPLKYESIKFEQGSLSFSIRASEAVLIEFDRDPIKC